MAEFSFDAATYARSASGLNRLISNLQGDIKRAGSKITGSEYNKFINTVKRNWSGADADRFLARFKSDVKNCKTSLDKYSKQIASTLRNDQAQFSKMQSRNANMIK